MAAIKIKTIPTSGIQPSANTKSSSSGPVLIFTAGIFLMLLVFLFMWCGEGSGSGSGSSACAGASCAGSETAGPVKELTAADLAGLSSNAGTCVMFYAPWCGYCRQMKPIFEAAAEKCTNTTFGIVNGDTECKNGGGPCTTYKVRGYPTVIKFIGNGEYETFQGPRTVQALVEFCNQ